MSDFSDFIGLVNSMMIEFGSEATLVTQIQGGEYDPVTGSFEAVTQNIPITCILMDMTLQSNGAGTRDKSLIQNGDKVLYVKPSAELLPTLMPNGVLVVDSSDDKVIVGGYTYDVVTAKAVDPTASATMPILFELYLRR